MYAKDLELAFNIKDPNSPLFNLLDNPEFMLVFNVASLAKNFNFLTQMDKYMKEFARISMNLPNKEVQQRLEEALSKEVCIVDLAKATVLDKVDLSYKE